MEIDRLLCCCEAGHVVVGAGGQERVVDSPEGLVKGAVVSCWRDNLGFGGEL